VCGRFAQQRPASELAEIFSAEPLSDELGARFNVAPTDPALVVVQRDERRAIVAYGWGLVPHWAEGPGVGRARAINARAETLTRSPLFRESLARRRCLVPVDAFYEWRNAGGVRQPFAIRRADHAPLVLAGLWAGRRDPETGIVSRTFSIVTTVANELIGKLHDRMPVVIEPDAWDRWLHPRPRDIGELHGLLVPAPAAELEMYSVATLVNNVRNDGPELLAPLSV
jgi:putative SOS response-associated peptidase YedK